MGRNRQPVIDNAPSIIESWREECNRGYAEWVHMIEEDIELYGKPNVSRLANAFNQTRYTIRKLLAADGHR